MKCIEHCVCSTAKKIKCAQMKWFAVLNASKMCDVASLCSAASDEYVIQTQIEVNRCLQRYQFLSHGLALVGRYQLAAQMLT